MRLNPSQKRKLLAPAFTLVEVVMAITIAVGVFAGIILAYTQTTYFAQWTGYSMAAQALAVQQIELTRSAVWDNTQNQITNVPLKGVTCTPTAQGYVWTGYTTAILDLPYSAGTNQALWATNYVTIRKFNIDNAASPVIPIQMISVDTVWPWREQGGNKVFCTNHMATIIAPDSTLL